MGVINSLLEKRKYEKALEYAKCLEVYKILLTK